jgi:hypothetical protein
VPVWLIPLVPLAAVVATDVWVYLDARRWATDGAPVFARVGTFSVETPVGWLLGCIVLWIVFFPLYLVCRRA